MIVFALGFCGFLDGLVILQEGTKPKPLDSKTLRKVNAKYVTEMKNLGNVKDPLAKKTLVNLDGLIDKENQAIR